jgi:hypothetical protein
VIDGPTIQTVSGDYVFPLDPWKFVPRIDDIAHALSMQCRFSGHSAFHYSVAQHSVLVSDLCPPEDRLWGLLHDASEAYLVDLPRPLKHDPLFGTVYRAAEQALQGRICHAFGLGLVEPDSVQHADLVVLETERRDLLPAGPAWLITASVRPLPARIEKWMPERARYEFLAQYENLSRRVAA